MRPRSSRFFPALVVLLLGGGLFGGEAGVDWYLEHRATPEQFARFASAEQAAVRNGEGGLALHRIMGYANRPGWEQGADRHNALGYRGEELDMIAPAGVFRIVCLGGTTTYAGGVADYREAYPYLLQAELRGRGFDEVEVVNGGVPGYGSLETLLDLQFRVLDLDPDLVIVDFGLSDVDARLVWPTAAYRGDQGGYIESPAQYRPPLWARSSLLRLIVVGLGIAAPQPLSSARSYSPQAESAYASAFAQQWAAGTYPQGIFREVSAAEMLAANPPVYFERNLAAIVATARANGVLVVLLTHPAGSAADERAVAAAPEIRAALAEHDAIVRLLGERLGVPVFDLAAALPDDPAFFAAGDDYAAAGNAARARLIAQYLASSGLLEGGE